MLLIEPVLVWYCLWSDAAGAHFFGSWRGLQEDGIFKGGKYFWWHSIYSYLLALAGTALLIRQYFLESGIYKAQLRIIILSIIPPLIGNFTYLYGMTPVLTLREFPVPIDFTPQAFLISGMMVVYALFRKGYMDVVPIARKTIVERMADGIVVLDKHNRILDINPAASEILGIDGTQLLGMKAGEVMQIPPALSADLKLSDRAEFANVIRTSNGKYLDLCATRLDQAMGNASGILVILRDVTVLRETSDALTTANQQLRNQSSALEAANQQLRLQVEEIEKMQILLREQAVRDGLTGLYNRRYMEETLVREIAYAQRTGQHLAIILIDIDYFKRVNDHYGHLAGDEMIIGLAEIFHRQTRTEDIACRYGGEEFVIILRNMTEESALAATEHWRASFEATRFSFKGQIARATFSAGIATFPEDGSDQMTLLEAADLALYAAKRAGRNKIFSSRNKTELAAL
jgi:diguanylate cyclase (GGDEF)-like protein/PAS domain S-box-containing protein